MIDRCDFGTTNCGRRQSLSKLRPGEIGALLSQFGLWHLLAKNPVGLAIEADSESLAPFGRSD